MRRFAIAAATVLVLSSPAQAGGAVNVQLSASYDFTGGRFGNLKDTEVSTASLAARFTWDKWRLRVYMPFLYIHGPAGGIVIDRGTGGKVSSSAHGLGDLTTTLTYVFDDDSLKPFYAVLGGSLRFPTGSYSGGLGVGAFDIGLQSEFGLSYAKGGVYLAPGWRFRGNHTSANQRLDGALLTSGFWINLNPDWQLGSYIAWSERITRKLSDQEDLGAYVRYQIDPDLSLQLYGGHGLSRASGDIDTGVRLQWSL